MKVTVDAHALRRALKQLQPSRKYKSMQESTVTATARESALVLTGSLDSSASLEAEVHSKGASDLPLDMAIRLLGTYPKGSRVVVTSEPNAVFFDKFRFGLK